VACFIETPGSPYLWLRELCWLRLVSWRRHRIVPSRKATPFAPSAGHSREEIRSAGPLITSVNELTSQVGLKPQKPNVAPAPLGRDAVRAAIPSGAECALNVGAWGRVFGDRRNVRTTSMMIPADVTLPTGIGTAMAGRTFIFRRVAQPDEVVHVTTNYLESPGEIEHAGVLWVRCAIEDGKTIFRPKTENEREER
jgi:hypothetical protein